MSVLPGATRYIYLDWGETGLVGTITFKLLNEDTLDEVIEETIQQIEEWSTGKYRSLITFPTSAGNYLAVWTVPGEGSSDEQFTVTGIVGTWTPDKSEIEALLRARTRDRFGNSGEFTEDTTPTNYDVELLINEAVTELAGVWGTRLPDAPGDDPDAIRAAARSAAALLASMNVELSYFPEQQTRADRSAYQLLERRFDRLVKSTKEAIAEANEQGGDGESVMTAGGARYRFDDEGSVTEMF
jgi:hypothetical protein